MNTVSVAGIGFAVFAAVFAPPLFAAEAPDMTQEPTGRQILERVRRAEPARTPPRFNAIPDRLGDILVDKHHYPDGEVWGLARSRPDQELPYDEMGSSTFIGLVKEYDLFDRVGPLTDEARARAVEFWQSWQNPETGRFSDPRDSQRVVNEKYIVGLLSSLGAEPLYPWTTTGTSKTVETGVFLARSLEDPDWANGGWSVGSHTGHMAVEVWQAINDGRPELIPDLELGMTRILAHQDPASGLWGPPTGELWRRIGGNLKVIGRFYFRMGLQVPHTRGLADTLIRHSENGDWFTQGFDSCVPRNVAEVVAYCLEVSDYRRDELLGVLDRLAEDYTHWVNPDGSLLVKRDDRENVGLQYTTLYGLGILGAYLYWEDCRLPNPLSSSARGRGARYRPVLQPDGSVRVVDTQTEEGTP